MSWVECECGLGEHLNDNYIGRVYKGPCYRCFKKLSPEQKEEYFNTPLEDRIIKDEMTKQVWKIQCKVDFTRSTPVPGVGCYRPHVVVEGDTEYKGVEFLTPLVIGENYSEFKCIFPKINYRPLLKRGVKFEIKEGPRTVGTGVVTGMRDQFCSQ